MSIIFLEGTSGVGKTTLADQSFDFVKYLDNNPEYLTKNKASSLQTLYNEHVHLDLIESLMNLKQNDIKKDVYFDRCFISQFAYNILFEFNGETDDSDWFQFNTKRNVFSKPEMVNMVKLRLEGFLKMVTKLTGRPSTIYWCISNDIEFTKCSMRSRNGFEIDREKKNGWNIENYIRNQNFLFKTLYECAKLGKLIEVDKYLNITNL